MATYVLIHGSFHGSWCWQRLIPLMEEKGQKIIAPDARGKGKEHQTYAKVVANILENQITPVILVGHSSGGMVISELVKEHPYKIKALVYLSAFLLPDGVYPPVVMKDDAVSLMPTSIIIDKESNLAYINKEKAKELFYADCPDLIAEWAISLLTPEPIVPKDSVNTTITFAPSQEIVDILRFYIETINDRALGINTQREMYKRLTCKKVYTLKTSHSSFLSAPDELADILLDINKEIN